MAEAIDWLCKAFGFTLRLRIANHRAQLNAGDGAVVVTERSGIREPGEFSVMVRFDDVDAHFARAKKSGVRVLSEPADHPYGERQYTAEDLAGHQWTFFPRVLPMWIRVAGAVSRASCKRWSALH